MLDRARTAASICADITWAVCIELEPYVVRHRTRIRTIAAGVAVVLAVWWLSSWSGAAPADRDEIDGSDRALAHRLDAHKLEEQCRASDLAYGCASLGTRPAGTPVCVLGSLPTSDDNQLHTAHRFVLWLDCTTRFWPRLEGPILVSAHSGRQLGLRDDLWITGNSLLGDAPVHVQGTAALCLGVAYHQANYTTLC